MVSDNSTGNTTTLMEIEQMEAASSMDTLVNVGSTLNEPLVHTVEDEKADTCLIGDDGVGKIPGCQAHEDNETSSDSIPKVNVIDKPTENARGTGGDENSPQQNPLHSMSDNCIDDTELMELDTLADVGSPLEEPPVLHTVENEKADTPSIGNDGLVDKIPGCQAHGDSETSSDSIPKANVIDKPTENARGTGGDENSPQQNPLHSMSDNCTDDTNLMELDTLANVGSPLEEPPVLHTVENEIADTPSIGDDGDVAVDIAQPEIEAVQSYSKVGSAFKAKYEKLRERQKQRLAKKIQNKTPQARPEPNSKLVGPVKFRKPEAEKVKVKKAQNKNPKQVPAADQHVTDARSDFQGFGSEPSNNSVFQGRVPSLPILSNHGKSIIPQGAQPHLYNQEQTQLGASILGLDSPPPPPPSSLSLYEKQYKLLEDLMQKSARSNELREKSETMELWTENELDSLWLSVRRHGCNWEAILRDQRFTFSQSKTTQQLARKWEEELRKTFGGAQYEELRQKYSSSSSSAGINERLTMGQFQSFAQLRSSTVLPPSSTSPSSLTNHQTVNMHNNRGPFSTNQIPPPLLQQSTGPTGDNLSHLPHWLRPVVRAQRASGNTAPHKEENNSDHDSSEKTISDQRG